MPILASAPADVDATWDDTRRLTRLLGLLGNRLQSLQETRAACADPEAVVLITARLAEYRGRHWRAWRRRQELAT